MKLTYSIQPTQSLVSSSQLIVDYIADKIEQSTPVGLIFNELLRFFETEALCLGPDFINNEIKEESNWCLRHPIRQLRWLIPLRGDRGRSPQFRY